LTPNLLQPLHSNNLVRAQLLGLVNNTKRTFTNLPEHLVVGDVHNPTPNHHRDRKVNFFMYLSNFLYSSAGPIDGKANTSVDRRRFNVRFNKAAFFETNAVIAQTDRNSILNMIYDIQYELINFQRLGKVRDGRGTG
jgi:hypothetical protein